MRTSRSFRWIATLVALLAACSDDPTSPQAVEDATFAAVLGIDLAQMTRLSSGVYVQTMVAGSGTAQVAATNTVVLDYILFLPSGVRLQGPARLPASLATGYIPGFSEGLIGMKVGETRRIIVPSGLAYGANPPEGSGIPKHSVLLFEVALVSLS